MRMTQDEIDDKLDEWHESASHLSFYEYMDWTFEEYKIWVETNIPPERD